MQSIVELFIQSKTGEAIIKIGYKSWHDEKSAFEQVYENQEDYDSVSKLETVPEHQPVQSLEVGNGIVTESCCLITFLAHNTDTNRSRLDHIDIITSITNGKSEYIWVTLNEFYNFSFIIWWWSVNYNRLSFVKDIPCIVTELRVAEYCAQRLSIDKERELLLISWLNYSRRRRIQINSSLCLNLILFSLIYIFRKSGLNLL